MPMRALVWVLLPLVGMEVRAQAQGEGALKSKLEAMGIAVDYKGLPTPREAMADFAKTFVAPAVLRWATGVETVAKVLEGKPLEEEGASTWTLSDGAVGELVVASPAYEASEEGEVMVSKMDDATSTQRRFPTFINGSAPLSAIARTAALHDDDSFVVVPAASANVEVPSWSPHQAALETLSGAAPLGMKAAEEPLRAQDGELEAASQWATQITRRAVEAMEMNEAELEHLIGGTGV